MKKKVYFCRDGQQVGAKAYARALDKDRVSHRGTPCLDGQASRDSANPEQKGDNLVAATKLPCLWFQYEPGKSVYIFSMAKQTCLQIQLMKRKSV